MTLAPQHTPSDEEDIGSGAFSGEEGGQDYEKFRGFVEFFFVLC